MKITTKRDGKFTWIALKDNKGYYHCWFSEEHTSDNFILAGHCYLSNGSQIQSIKRLLKKEGHR